MKKSALIVIALIVLVLGVVASRPPGAWSSVTVGMSRQDVYARLGQPRYSSETGFDYWQKDLLIGRWELSVAFHADGTVGVSGCHWRWDW